MSHANMTVFNDELFKNDTSLFQYDVSAMNGNYSDNDTYGDRKYMPRTYKSPPLQLEDIVTLPFYSLIFILSVVGNLLVIITLIQNKRMRTVTNVFLLNLSISDLLLAVFCMPFTIIPIMLKNFIFGAAMCVLIRYLQAVSVSVSCFTLVAISLERYFAICRPLHSRRWQTLSHSYKTIAFCWLSAFIVCIPQAVFNKYRELPMGNARCLEIWPSDEWHKAYSVLLDLILLLVPILIMALSYGSIAYTLWSGMKLDKEIEAQNGEGQIFKMDSMRTNGSAAKDGFGRTIGPSDINNVTKSHKSSTKLRFNARGIRQSNNEKSRAAKKRVIKMLFAVVLEFFICWTPLFVLQTWMTIDINHAQQNFSQITLTTVFLLSYVSSCCNPITYCFMNKNFRNGFKSAFRCCNRGEGLRTRNEMPSYYHYSSARTGMSQVSTYDKINIKDDSDEI